MNLCSVSLSALQAATILIAMVSEKKFGDYIFQTGRQIGDLCSAKGWLDIEQLCLV